MNLEEQILTATEASGIASQKTIQNLWSGYGEIVRVTLVDGNCTSVIVKKIQPSQKINHPKGWNTNASSQRKIKSYEIEQYWHEYYSERLTSQIRVPQLIFTHKSETANYIVMEDLDAAGYSNRYQGDSLRVAKTVIVWLAQFHALFMNVEPTGLWSVGTYWHLATRKEEYNAMEAGALKEQAKAIDQKLNSCRFKTIVHGDAKLANFCFNADYNKVAAVDFQYVGGGCGMKDLAYFLGSIFDARQLETYEEECLNFYFEHLKENLDRSSVNIDFNELEEEWCSLYAFSWADFSRFLIGWLPSHEKLNAYSEKMIQRTLNQMI